MREAGCTRSQSLVWSGSAAGHIEPGPVFNVLSTERTDSGLQPDTGSNPNLRHGSEKELRKSHHMTWSYLLTLHVSVTRDCQQPIRLSYFPRAVWILSTGKRFKDGSETLRWSVSLIPGYCASLVVLHVQLHVPGSKDQSRLWIVDFLMWILSSIDITDWLLRLLSDY